MAHFSFIYGFGKCTAEIGKFTFFMSHDVQHNSKAMRVTLIIKAQ